MMLFKAILIGVQALSGLLLIVMVLLHSPKGDGVGLMSGASSLFASQKGAEATLDKMTSIIAGVFFVVSFGLGYYL
jgi:preprotein translocase subunit SecG